MTEEEAPPLAWHKTADRIQARMDAEGLKQVDMLRRFPALNQGNFSWFLRKRRACPAAVRILADWLEDNPKTGADKEVAGDTNVDDDDDDGKEDVGSSVGTDIVEAVHKMRARLAAAVAKRPGSVRRETGFVYVMNSPTRDGVAYKVGYSHSAEGRCTQLRTGNPDLRLEFACHTADVRAAEAVARELLRDTLYRGEFHKCTLAEAQMAVTLACVDVNGRALQHAQAKKPASGVGEGIAAKPGDKTG